MPVNLSHKVRSASHLSSVRDAQSSISTMFCSKPQPDTRTAILKMKMYGVSSVSVQLEGPKMTFQAFSDSYGPGTELIYSACFQLRTSCLKHKKKSNHRQLSCKVVLPTSAAAITPLKGCTLIVYIVLEMLLSSRVPELLPALPVLL